MNVWLKDQSPTQDHQLKQCSEHLTIMIKVLYCHYQVIVFTFDQEKSIPLSDIAQFFEKIEKDYLWDIKC